jgi:hypothetical protein
MIEDSPMRKNWGGDEGDVVVFVDYVRDEGTLLSKLVQN